MSRKNVAGFVFISLLPKAGTYFVGFVAHYNGIDAFHKFGIAVIVFFRGGNQSISWFGQAILPSKLVAM